MDGDALLAWGRANLRDLPWRRTRDPWAVLLAETMLQQTQVARVMERWGPLLARFPDPAATAAAAPAEVVRAWAGLGYNRRGLNLHRAAVTIVEAHGGAVPSGIADLEALPGVGPYTSRAVRAFAFELAAAPVDTNIGRVLARQAGAPLAPREAQQRADGLVAEHPTEVWLWNQSLMELGATICTKRAPACGVCPAAHRCAWRGATDRPDPAVGSAGVSTPQRPFAGSDRQLRGRLVDALRVGPLTVADVAGLLAVGADRRDRVVAGLVADGLVAADGAGDLRLAGD